MKTFLISLVVEVIFVPSLFSQNYECLKDDGIYYYKRLIAEPGGGQNPIRAYRIDSIGTVGNDMMLYTQKEIIDRAPGDPAGCWDPDAGSWIGDVRVTPEGDYYFYSDGYVYNNLSLTYTHIHETMLIKSRAGIGDSWTFYSNDTVGIYAIAEVTGIDTMSFLEVTDSVKFISVYRASDNELLFTLKLSKNYGLIRILNFRDFFPEGFYPFNTYDDRYETYELSGMEGNGSGVHKLTRGEVYDFNVGDEFDVFAEEDDDQGNLLAFIYYINIILDKSFSSDQDTVYYTIDSLSWALTYEGTIISHDTIERKYFNLQQELPDDQYLPFETRYYDDNDVSYFSMYSFYNERIHIYDQWEYYTSQEDDSCFYSIFLLNGSRTPALVLTESINGCGSYYTELTPDGNFCVYCSLLMYYCKGEEEWGDPLDPPVGIEENKDIAHLLRLYPNPANDIINVSSNPSKSSIQNNYKLINSAGSVVREFSTGESEFKIDLEELPSGLYLLIATTGEGWALHEKVIISR